MFDFIQNLIYSFLALQEKVLRKKMRINLRNSYSNKTSKRVFGTAASLEISSKTNANKIRVENNVINILKKCGNKPEILLKFIQKSGTQVYKIPFADKILALIGYEEGFVSSTKGIKALYLNIITAILTGEKIKLSFNTEPMFILRDLPLDCYCMVQQFHKWYAMKLNMPGFDAESQENFQKFLNISHDEKIKELTIEEILGLKEAIARDVEAINFIVDLAKSTAGSKKAMQKITTGGANI